MLFLSIPIARGEIARGEDDVVCLQIAFDDESPNPLRREEVVRGTLPGALPSLCAMGEGGERVDQTADAQCIDAATEAN